MHLPNETSVTTLNAVTVNVWLWLEIILNKPRRLVLSAKELQIIDLQLFWRLGGLVVFWRCVLRVLRLDENLLSDAKYIEEILSPSFFTVHSDPRCK